MRSVKYSSRNAGRKRRSRAKTQPLAGAREFLRHTFYYLKGEQLLNLSRRLMYEAA